MGRYERSAGMTAIMNQGPTLLSPRTELGSKSSPSPTTPVSPYNEPDTYNAGDIAMENVYASPLSSPDAFTHGDKNGSYMSLNGPVGKHDPDNQSLLSHHSRRPHTKHFDHNQARKHLFKTGGYRLLVTILFSALMCITLKAWEGFHGPLVLSKKDIRIFNSLMIALSLCLGLNLLGSLENYAGILRWSLLSRRYVSLETFDLILGLEKLSNVVRLMVISLPLVRRWKYLHRFGWFKDVRQDGSRWTWLVCLTWLGINIGSQVLIALSSLFYPMDASMSPLLTHGSVVIADLTRWQPVEDPDTKQSLDFEKAWMLGMEAIAYTDYMPNDTQKDLSILSGTPLYKYEDSYGYRFFNRNPIHQYSDYFLSNRIMYARATCDELDVKEGIVVDDSTFSIEGRLPTATDWTKYYLPEYAGGALTWMASVPEYCGARCTNFTVVQPALKSYNITKTSLFLCNSTVSMVEWGVDGPDIGIGNDTDAFAAFGSDDWARTASGAIGWTGMPTIGWEDIQWRTYTQGSKWSPVSIMDASTVADILMRFTIGAIAAFDDHGVRHNITGTVPAQGQQLNVDWSYMLSILGGICFIQFAAFCCLVLFANRTIIRDESYFSMAMLLSPVIGRISKDSGRMNMSGDEIKQDPKLRYEKVQYSYREGKDGGPHQVDILFYGRDSRESRKSWAAGIYS